MNTVGPSVPATQHSVLGDYVAYKNVAKNKDFFLLLLKLLEELHSVSNRIFSKPLFNQRPIVFNIMYPTRAWRTGHC